MTDVSKRLDLVSKIAGLKNKKELSEFIDIPYSTLSKWVTRNKITSDGILSIIKAGVPISINYLETGLGDAELTSSGVSNYNHEESIDNAEKMYRELSIEDKQIVYAVIKRLHQTSSALDDAVDKAFGE